MSLVWAVVLSTRTITRTTPLVWGSEKTARAIPPRLVVWEGASVALLAHSGSSSNITGTPSTARPWASCTRTITSATWGYRAAAVKSSTPTQMVAGKTCREKTYPAPAVGPTSCGAQARSPKPRMSPYQGQNHTSCHSLLLPVRARVISEKSLHVSPSPDLLASCRLRATCGLRERTPGHCPQCAGPRRQWRPGVPGPENSQRRFCRYARCRMAGLQTSHWRPRL